MDNDLKKFSIKCINCYATMLSTTLQKLVYSWNDCWIVPSKSLTHQWNMNLHLTTQHIELSHISPTQRVSVCISPFLHLLTELKSPTIHQSSTELCFFIRYKLLPHSLLAMIVSWSIHINNNTPNIIILLDPFHTHETYTKEHCTSN